VSATDLEYCDGAGIAYLHRLARQAEERGIPFTLDGLDDRFRKLLDAFAGGDFAAEKNARTTFAHLPQQIGQFAVDLCTDFVDLIVFVGHVAAASWETVKNPRRIRWRDVFLIAENVGVNAIGIVALISFLIGLIMAFQSALPMKQFGAVIYVTDIVAISMLRELGPLMTAIIIAGRSGSAFAAELGAMKVNEEINALSTMGLDPVKFLVVTRTAAAVIMTPLLVLFSDLMGVIGGGVVILSLGFPVTTYVNQLLGAVELSDLFSGLLKSVVFAVLVAGIGCLRGLQTRAGAGAVGLSTTRAVVSGIVLIVLADGVFSVMFYYLDF
jgi:phospholipid/cholesterol/gamma-HCH transport system permease protein